jgi:hypothetical protein
MGGELGRWRHDRGFCADAEGGAEERRGEEMSQKSWVRGEGGEIVMAWVMMMMRKEDDAMPRVMKNGAECRCGRNVNRDMVSWGAAFSKPGRVAQLQVV